MSALIMDWHSTPKVETSQIHHQDIAPNTEPVNASTCFKCDLCDFISDNKSIILNSIYFKAIQTAVFYQKNTYRPFTLYFLMFLDLEVSCDQKKLKIKKNGLLKSGLKKLVGWIVEASETAKECKQFPVFFYYFLAIFFFGSFETILKAFFHEPESILFEPFFFVFFCFF